MLFVSAQTCKSRWNNIRDNYRKSLKKISTRSGQSSKKVKFYKFSEQLEFLNTFFKERHASIENQDEDIAEEHDKEEFVENQTENMEEISMVKDHRVIPVSHKIGLHIGQQSRNLSKNKASPTKKASCERLQYLLGNKSNQSTSVIDPVDTFLAGIGSTLKTLNPYFLNLAKTEIFNTVQKYEMKMITTQYPAFTCNYNVDETAGHFSVHSPIPTPLISPQSAEDHPVRNVTPLQNQHENKDFTFHHDIMESARSSPEPVLNQNHETSIPALDLPKAELSETEIEN